MFRIAYTFTIRNKNIDYILKNYFNDRFSYSNAHITNMFMDISRQTNYKNLDKDHRWISLKINTEKNIHNFNLQEKISILKVLAKVQSFDTLSQKLIQQIKIRMNELTLDQLCLVLWVQTKEKKPNLPLIKGICSQMNSQFQNKTTIYNKMRNQAKLEENVSAISTKNIGLAIWSLSALRISDPVLLRFLLKQSLSQNIQLFSTQTLCIVLFSLKTLNLQRKRIAYKIKQHLKSRQSELQQQPILTLRNLLNGICYMPDPDKNMALWVTETILLKQQHEKFHIRKKMASLILVSLRKAKVYDLKLYKELVQTIISDIKQAKQKDLVMTLQCIVDSPLRNKFREEEAMILERIWKIYHVFNGKSKQIMGELYVNHQIQVPHTLKQSLQEQHRQKMAKIKQSKQQ